MPIKRTRDVVSRELYRARQRLASSRRTLARDPSNATTVEIAERILASMPRKIAALEVELAGMPEETREERVGGFAPGRGASGIAYRTTPMSAAEIATAGDLEIPAFLRRSK